MRLHYLEVVTPDVDGFCTTHQMLNGTVFGEPEPLLGNARLGELESGGRIGVRAPMQEAEEAVTRPYFLTNDINADTQNAENSGAEVIHPPMEIPGLGKFSIFILGGIQQGLWQV
jgi:hypothetical protein